MNGMDSKGTACLSQASFKAESINETPAWFLFFWFQEMYLTSHISVFAQDGGRNSWTSDRRPRDEQGKQVGLGIRSTGWWICWTRYCQRSCFGGKTWKTWASKFDIGSNKDSKDAVWSTLHDGFFLWFSFPAAIRIAEALGLECIGWVFTSLPLDRPGAICHCCGEACMDPYLQCFQSKAVVN